MVHIDTQQIKFAARGRWRDILTALGNIPPENLDGKHHPCHKCGGADRFRFSDLDGDGSIICSKCGEKIGDGIGALQWATGYTFPVVARMLQSHLRLSNGNGNGHHLDPLQLLAQKKRCPVESLKRYGATANGPRVEFPVYDVAGVQCSTFAIDPRSNGKAGKGLLAKGKPAGVFLPHDQDVKPIVPKAGETWYIVEGVKDAAALDALGLLALGLPTCKLSAKFAPMLTGVAVVLIPDRDEAGVNGAETTAGRLHKSASTVKIAALPVEFKASEGADVRDVLALPDGRKLLQSAIDTAQPWAPARPSRDDSGEPAVTNFEVIEIEDDVGEVKKVKVPLRMDTIIDEVRRLTDGWPRRVDHALFVHDDKHGVSWFEKPQSLFGYFHRRVGQVRWHMTTGSVAMSELFAELQRTATKYVSVESLPHEPPMPDHYYAVEPIPPGDGSTLRKLLARFAPATDIDGDLILSAFLTPMWGGPPGCRPCYVITSDDGRGAGKSTLAEMIGAVYDGVLQFSHLEDIATIKTRLLSPEALTKRVALIDNIKSNKFSWGELEGTITASTIGGRRLYVGEATRPNTLTWFLTLNGAALSTDMAQRAIIVKVRRPERSATWFEETGNYIRDNQRAILGDIIAMLRGPVGMRLSRFTRWATWERDVLQRLPEPSDAQAVIIERQAAVDVDGEEASIIEEHFGDQLRRLGYDIEAERVFLPSQLVARWYGWATNQQNIAVISAGRQVNQMATEGRLRRIGISTGRSWGRGFLWTGENWPGMHTCTDVQERIRDQQRKDA